jgi:carboxypeptidase Q
MRFRRSTSALFVALFSALASAGQEDMDAAKVIALGRAENRVMEHLDHLVNRIGPRLTGSDNFRNACAWARERFESFGLVNCRLEKWGEFPVGFNRGPSSGRMVAPEKKELHFATDAWTAGTLGTVSGPAVLAPADAAELEAVRPRLAGAWVVAPPSPGRGGAGARTARDREGAAAERAFRDSLEKAYDAAGVAGTIRAGRGDLVLTGGRYKVDFEKLPTRPSITLLAAEHQSIVDHLKAGEEVRLEFDVRNWFVKGPIAVSNVIAEIPGTEKPDEVVIVGGHLDSWDGATGTTDNGTGVATTLEAARLLAKSGVKPKRTIRFMLWGGEEEGLLGSRAYVKEHKDEMAKISAVLVHDGGTNYCDGITATPPMVKDLERIFAPVASLDPEMPFKVREVKGLSGGGSDHASFLQADVPGFFWSQKGSANYNHTHHTQFDTFDQAVPQYEKNSSIVIAVGALGIANLPSLLPRENLRAPEGGGRRLGVDLADDMTIEEVMEDGLAAKIGLQKGDRVLKIGDRTVADRDELRTVLREAPTSTKVVVLRSAKEVEFPVELPAADAGPGGGLGRRLGLRLGDGLTVDVVTPGGPADQAGIASGDRITKVGTTAVESFSDLGEALPASGGETKVSLARDGKEVVVTVKVPERP